MAITTKARNCSSVSLSGDERKCASVIVSWPIDR